MKIQHIRDRNAKSGRKQSFIITIMLILLTLLVLPVLAGEGDGSGGGKNISLGLVFSSPADGEEGVALQPEIKLSFNKNIINLAVRDNNKNCFALYDIEGSRIPVEVIMADDQIYPEERRNLSLKPLQELQAGTVHMVKISPELQAKNGTYLGGEVTIRFVTTGAAPQMSEPENTPITKTTQENDGLAITPKENTTVPENSSSNPAQGGAQPTGEKANLPSADEDKPMIEEKIAVSQDEAKKQSSNKIAIASGLLLIAALGYAGKKFRK